MAGKKQPDERPKTRLDEVIAPSQMFGDGVPVEAKTVNIIEYDKRPAEFDKGTEEHDYLCANKNCDVVIMRGWTENGARRMTFNLPVIVRCTCKTLSAIPHSLLGSAE